MRHYLFTRCSVTRNNQVTKAVFPSQQTKILNEILFDILAMRDPGLEKQAVDAVNDFTRRKMREDGFYRRILPPSLSTDRRLSRSSIPHPLRPAYKSSSRHHC